MPTYRIAVERTYTDVSVQYVTDDTEEEARRRAILFAREDDRPSPTEFAGVVQCDVIECEEEPDARNDPSYDPEAAP